MPSDALCTRLLCTLLQRLVSWGVGEQGRGPGGQLKLLTEADGGVSGSRLPLCCLQHRPMCVFRHCLAARNRPRRRRHSPLLLLRTAAQQQPRRRRLWLLRQQQQQRRRQQQQQQDKMKPLIDLTTLL